MPTPKVPRRKSTIQDAMVSHLAELNDASQLSDSESKYALSINIVMPYLHTSLLVARQFGHANAFFSVFIDRIRNQFLKK